MAALVLGLSLPLTRAQDAPPTNTVASAAVATTLDALVTEALEKNLELKFYTAEIAAAKAGRKTAGQLGNPEVSGGVGQKRVSSPGLSDEGIAWSVSVVQPLEWPGRIAVVSR